MARAYYFTVNLRLADEESDSGFGSGSRTEFRHGGEWASDEDLDRQAATYTEYIARNLKHVRDAEMNRDRQAAKPFWQRWLGA